jgi:hypothetical protein
VPNGGWWYSYLAAWAGSEHDILAEDNFSYELARVDTPCGNATCPANNLTIRNSTIVPAGASWPPAAQAIADAAGASWWP